MLAVDKPFVQKNLPVKHFCAKIYGPHSILKKSQKAAKSNIGDGELRRGVCDGKDQIF